MRFSLFVQLVANRAEKSFTRVGVFVQKGKRRPPPLPSPSSAVLPDAIRGARRREVRKRRPIKPSVAVKNNGNYSRFLRTRRAQSTSDFRLMDSLRVEESEDIYHPQKSLRNKRNPKRANVVYCERGSERENGNYSAPATRRAFVRLINVIHFVAQHSSQACWRVNYTGVGEQLTSSENSGFPERVSFFFWERVFETIAFEIEERTAGKNSRLHRKWTKMSRRFVYEINVCILIHTYKREFKLKKIDEDYWLNAWK